MENGGKEKQCFASKTSEAPVSGGKGWQFCASIFSKTKNLDAKTKNQRQDPAYQNTGNKDFGGTTFKFGDKKELPRLKELSVSSKDWNYFSAS